MTEISPLHAIHHMAFRCRDAEETRAFWEDVLAMPLAAALAFDKDPAGQPLDYMHLFFALGDGNFIAFFDLPDHADEALFAKKWGMDLHMAISVDSYDTMMAYKARIKEKANKTVIGPIDHGFVHSIYFYDPNGLQCEITCRDAKYDEILAAEKRATADEMAKWQARKARRRAAAPAG